MFGSIIKQSQKNTEYRMLELGQSLGDIEIPDENSYIDIRHSFPFWILEQAESDSGESYFVDFIQEYFNWLYSKSGFELNKTEFHLSGLGKLIDIDSTSVKFLPRISYSYASGISSLFNYENRELDVVSFLKNIRENLYQKKSTEESYRYFFQTLFKSASIQLSYPKENIFRLNQGRFEGWSTYIPEGGSTAAASKTLGPSFLNSESKIQDSDWYQDFSYLVKAGIDANPDTGLPIYYEELNSMLHPAGLKGFFERVISDYVPPNNALNDIYVGEMTKLSNYFAYRLTDSSGYSACMGCSGSEFGYDGPTAYIGGETGGWTSGDAWSIVGAGSISAEYNIPTHNWPDWDDDIDSGIAFESIHIGDFIYLYPDDESPNLGMTGCTASGGAGECWV